MPATLSLPIEFGTRAKSMAKPVKVWTVVLAGGDGTRLATLTQDDTGHQVPKQFWSLSGGPTLVDNAVRRAWQVAPPGRTCVIVAEKHRHHWSGALPAVDERNIIVQPRNCGTAIGVLLATLHIAKRDPLARIVFLPADHYVDDEALLATSMQEAAALLSGMHDDIVLLGIEPDGIDCELGYIVPGTRSDDGALTVDRFVEKPDTTLAESLLASGAVWNSFIFASKAQSLIDLMYQYMPNIVDDMWHALVSHARKDDQENALQDLYQNLLPIDFSRTMLQKSHDNLRLVTAPACGWTDLGTPKRVARVVRQRLDSRLEFRPQQNASSGVLSLAAQCARLGVVGA